MVATISALLLDRVCGCYYQCITGQIPICSRRLLLLMMGGVVCKMSKASPQGLLWMLLPLVPGLQSWC